MKRQSVVLVMFIVVCLLAACGPTPEPQVVEKDKLVTQIVKETVIVAGTPEIVEKVITATPAPVSQREIVIATEETLETVDPHIDIKSLNRNVTSMMFDALVWRNADMQLVPGLAESWEAVDNLTYVFHLRKGVRFHNGEEFTADDVLFSFERMQTPSADGPYAPYKFRIGRYLEPFVASIEALDEYTVQFNLKAPWPIFLPRLTVWAIVPQEHVQAVGDEEFARHPIGTGPYRFVELVIDDHFSVEANEDYWGGAPSLKRVAFKFIPEAATRVAALLAGEVDVISKVTPEDMPRLIADRDLRVATADSFSYSYYILNSFKPPFDDVRVRKAVNYAIDWDAIIALFEGYAVRNPLPANVFDFGYAEYADGLMQYTYNYDPDKARALLAEAGYADGFELTISLPKGQYAKGDEIALAVAEQLAQVGIKATVESLEAVVYEDTRYRAGEMQMGYYASGNSLFDPEGGALVVQFDPDRATGNFYRNDKVAELIHQGAQIVDLQERVDVYRQATQLLLEDAAYVWGIRSMELYAFSADIDWKPRSDTRIFPQEMTLITN